MHTHTIEVNYKLLRKRNISRNPIKLCTLYTSMVRGQITPVCEFSRSVDPILQAKYNFAHIH